MEQSEQRAANADRERVAEQLRLALNEGRLDLTEYDERLQAVYAAKTYADLGAVTTDLPGTVPTAKAQLAVPADGQVVGQRGSSSRPALRAVLGGWLGTAIVTTGIWAAVSISAGRPVYFWPLWVIIPMGAAMLAKLVKGDDFGHDRSDRRARRDERRNR